MLEPQQILSQPLKHSSQNHVKCRFGIEKRDDASTNFTCNVVLI